MTRSISVLHSRNFRLLVITRIFTAMALQAQAIIVGWQVYSITKSTFLLGLTGLTEAVPALAGALVAGHIVDNTSPLAAYRVCIGLIFLNTLCLLLFAGGIFTAPGGNLLPWIFGGVFISGLARSLGMPASFTMLSRIVSKPDLAAAAGWMSSGIQVAAIAGPAIAGIIYGGYGPHGAWLAPFILISLSCFISFFIGIPKHASAGEKREPALKSIRAGWHFILRSPVLLSVMVLDMFAVLFGGATAMLPAYADRILHVGSEGLGALRAAPALGAIIMSVFLAVRPMKRLSAARLMAAIAGFGACMIGFGLSWSFPLSMAFLALSGVFDSISVVTRGTIAQVLTPDNMRGRVSAISSMFIISSNEIGAFESGVAAKALGLVPSVVVGGLCTLAVVAVVAFSSPKFRKTIVETQ